MCVPLNGNRSSKTPESFLTTSPNEKISERGKISCDTGLEPDRLWSVPDNKRQAGLSSRLLNCHHRVTGRRNNLRLDRLISKFFV